jgi:hypothetical protein
VARVTTREALATRLDFMENSGRWVFRDYDTIWKKFRKLASATD